MQIALIITGIITFIGLILLAAWFYDKKRSEAMQVIADALNFSFERKGDELLIAMHDDFELLAKGHAKKASNVMHGRSGDMDVTIMDYQYTIGHGKNSSTHLHSIIIVQSIHLLLPLFTLAPENIFHKIGGVFGYQDIDFSSHPKFSKQYLLRGEDEDAIRETFSDELLKFYEKNKTSNTEGNNDKFVFFRTGKRLRARDIQAFLQEGIKLYGLFKTQTSGLH